MFRSFRDLQHIDPGFFPHGLLTFHILKTPASGNTPGEREAARAAFMRQLSDRLRSIPGVRSVGAASPFSPRGRLQPYSLGYRGSSLRR